MRLVLYTVQLYSRSAYMHRTATGARAAGNLARPLPGEQPHGGTATGSDARFASEAYALFVI